jgi:MarR family transcriptional regulator, negative regulator of the multidrug operon emrRAB
MNELSWNFLMRGTVKLTSVSRSTPAMAAALPELPMDQAVMVRLVRILSASMTEYFDPVFRRVGLSENSFHVLCLLMAAEQGQASPTELSEMVGTSKANMTRILDDLAGDGLISRTVEARDARRYVIVITARGRKRATEVVPKISTPLTRAFAKLSAQELTVLETALGTVIRSLDESD